MRIFRLHEATIAANPGVPIVFEKRWRCSTRQGGRTVYSIHKTREEAELSARSCHGAARVFETLEELFDI